MRVRMERRDVRKSSMADKTGIISAVLGSVAAVGIASASLFYMLRSRYAMRVLNVQCVCVCVCARA